MAGTFDALAGLGPGGPPLTFGDLWGPEAVAPQESVTERDQHEAHVDPAERAAAAARRVDLVVLTTNLTF